MKRPSVGLSGASRAGGGRGQHTIQVQDLSVEVVRKDLKNLNIRVYPPDGRVRVAVPRRVSDEQVRALVVDKMGWILRQQEKFAARPRPAARMFETGERCELWGRGYTLVLLSAPSARVSFQGEDQIELRAPAAADATQREAILARWYRQQMKRAAAPLIEKWAGTLGVCVKSWGVRQMRTRWGTCNPGAARIWLSLELSKRPVECLEYVIVHELAHLIEANHGPKFVAILDRHLPGWREIKARL